MPTRPPAADDHDGAWLARPAPFRVIGAVALDRPYTDLPVAEAFDLRV